MYWHKAYTWKWKFLKQKCFFFANAVAHVFSGTYTYLLWKKFLKVLLFHQSSAKFPVEITHFYLSHSYYKASLKKMIANLRIHNLKHDSRITLVEVFRVSKTCTFSKNWAFTGNFEVVFTQKQPPEVFCKKMCF